MRLVIPAAFALATLAACQPTNDPQMNSTVTGATVGGVLGAAVSDDGDRIEGALIGATVGAAAGLLLGQTDDGNCRYRRPDGSEYIAACP
jgi:outer membrane lipoprotein SlyB